MDFRRGRPRQVFFVSKLNPGLFGIAAAFRIFKVCSEVMVFQICRLNKFTIYNLENSIENFLGCEKNAIE